MWRRWHRRWRWPIVWRRRWWHRRHRWHHGW